MLARRVIAISPDKSMAKRMGLALMAAGGSVETLPSIDSIGSGEIFANCVVVHIDGGSAVAALRPLIARLEKRTAIVVILPRSDLAETVAVMELSDHVAGVLIADQLENGSLSSAVSRILYGDIFGLEKLVPWGNRVYSMLVGDYQEKSMCIAEISEFAGAMRVRRKYREAIEQCVDEMLMNALYDAPVDASGQMLFAQVPVKSRISMRLEQKAVVQYACDGSTFTISVRDNYGTLARETVMQYLHKCIHSEDQIDRKLGGAGLGLYIMANASTKFMFNVLPGVATECICSFDLTVPKVQLKNFGFFEERIDATGRLIGDRQSVPARAVVPGRAAPISRSLMFFLSSAIALLMILIGLVAYDRLRGPGSSSVAVETGIADCDIEVEGSARGRTDADGNLLVSNLEVGAYSKIVARCQGHGPAEAVVRPVDGQPVPLTLSPEPLDARLRVTANVADVNIYRGDQLLGTTPATLDALPPGETVTLSFRRAGYAAVDQEIRVPEPGEEAALSISLSLSAEYGSFQIASEPAGAEVLKNGELIVGKKTPIDDVLVEADKSYTFMIRKPGYQTARISGRVRRGERSHPLEVTLEPGGSLTVTSNLSGKVTFSESAAQAKCGGRTPIESCGLANGEYRAHFEGSSSSQRDFKVTINDDLESVDLRFGIFRAKRGYKVRLRPSQGWQDEVAYPVGQRVNVQYVKQGSSSVRTVELKAQTGRPTLVP